MELYVGNLPYEATEKDLEELKELFKGHGKVKNFKMLYQQDDRFRGFGFVVMLNENQANDAIAALDGFKFKGRPLKVNPSHQSGQRQRQQRTRQRQQEQPRQRQTTMPKSQTESTDKFHNPYTFVPTPPRNKIDSNNFAADFNPLDKEKGLNHATLQDDLWTGHIPIKITTVTPLVLLKDDGKERKPGKHRKYDVHSRIPEPSLRGMLRSAYEVITNSRYSSFRNDDNLAYRMETDGARALIPAIIKNGNVHLYPGKSKITNGGPRGKNGEVLPYAAMLTLYNQNNNLNTLLDNNYTPKTGDEVWAEILLCQHEVSRRGQNYWNKDFQFWKVIKIWKKDTHTDQPQFTNETICPTNCPNLHPGGKQSYYTPINSEDRKMVKGYVFITNQNMGNKHDERVFFNLYSKPFYLSDKLKDAWCMRIQSYRKAHSESDIFYRNNAQKVPWKYIDNQPSKTAWSPHQYQDSRHRNIWKNDPHKRSTTHDALELKDGDMAYVRCDIDDETGEIEKVLDLFPVMISRELYEKSPKDLLDESLRPAGKLKELSPADRLFGWTPQGDSSDSGYKSRIRIVCDDGERPDILESFEDDPLPLSILGEPKPEQGRFYVAADDKGTPQEGISKQKAGYDTEGNKQLRGRKHYWHHKGLENDTNKGKNHWNPYSIQDREYIRKGKTQDTQNRSIKGWIKPQKVFEASLYVQNLEPEEVGALLWLLKLPEDHYYKLGYGKPLGFGSVKIEIDTERLENGCLPLGNSDNWKEYYKCLKETPPQKLGEDKQKEFIDKFTNCMIEAYQQQKEEGSIKPKEAENQTENEEQKSISNLSLSDQLNSLPIDKAGGLENQDGQDFDKLPFIKGFLKVLQGPDEKYPIHYPRTDPDRDPDGKNFEWFVDNERGRSFRVAGRNEVGKQLGLPDVNADDQELPYTPSEPT